MGCLAALAAVMPGAPQVFRDCWVYVITRLGTDQFAVTSENLTKRNQIGEELGHFMRFDTSKTMLNFSRISAYINHVI